MYSVIYIIFYSTQYLRQNEMMALLVSSSVSAVGMEILMFGSLGAALIVKTYTIRKKDLVYFSFRYLGCKCL